MRQLAIAIELTVLYERYCMRTRPMRAHTQTHRQSWFSSNHIGPSWAVWVEATKPNR